MLMNIFAEPRISARELADGNRLLRSEVPLGEYRASVGALLRAGAEAHPDRPLIAQRTAAVAEGGLQQPGLAEGGLQQPQGWRVRSYREVRDQADAIGQALLDRGLGQDRALMVLSGNSIEHLVMTLGALTAGIPVVPVSVAYSLRSKDFQRLREIRELVRPGAVFADDAAAYGPALRVFDEPDVTSVVASGAGKRAERFDDLAATPPRVELANAFDAIAPDALAKILFTSGSTGSPKGVLTTHRMLCANQVMVQQVWPFLAEEPPVLVDWLPWSHTFGGNHNVNLVLANGGTLYIDDGRPAPELFGQTIANLREVPPTIYFNVPAGFAQLVPVLERDRELAESFFSRLRLVLNGAAALPPAVRERLVAAGESTAGRRIPVTAGWGATETAPAATYAHYPFTDARCIGVPLPGCEIKLTPVDDAHEIRVRGPHVTPGYLNRPDLTAAAFDEDGFYRSGDAVRMADPDDPGAGFLFCGRIAEDFKLTTGTFVRVAAVRSALLSAAPVLSDAVIAGEGRDRVCALAWLNLTEIRALLGEDVDTSGELVDDKRLRDHLARVLATVNAQAGSSSTVDGLVLMARPADLDAGEITDKGYVNQRRVLAARADLVELLYAEPRAKAVITADGSGTVTTLNS